MNNIATQRVMPLSAWIGLGANLGDTIATLKHARCALDCLPTTQVSNASSLYSSAPIGDTEQDRFVNAVCRLTTHLSPGVLLGALHGIEQVAGRRRGARRFGPRPLDLDLLLYGHGANLTVHTPNMSVPHPRMNERRFVLEPLAEIDPNLRLPGWGVVSAMLAATQAQDCHLLTATL